MTDPGIAIGGVAGALVLAALVASGIAPMTGPPG